MPSPQDLHAADFGPVFWAVGKVLDWGASSPRVSLMLAAQLAALLHLRPSLLQAYSAHVRTLLLRGSGGKGEGM